MATMSIHDLANMVEKESTASQDHLAESIAELLASQGDSLSDREKALMAGMLRQLLADAFHMLDVENGGHRATTHGNPTGISVVLPHEPKSKLVWPPPTNSEGAAACGAAAPCEVPILPG